MGSIPEFDAMDDDTVSQLYLPTLLDDSRDHSIAKPSHAFMNLLDFEPRLPKFFKVVANHFPSSTTTARLDGAQVEHMAEKKTPYRQPKRSCHAAIKHRAAAIAPFSWNISQPLILRIGSDVALAR